MWIHIMGMVIISLALTEGILILRDWMRGRKRPPNP